MQATRLVLLIALLLSSLLSGPAVAEYPFDSIPASGSPRETVAPIPSRPLPRGARERGLLNRAQFLNFLESGGVTHTSHDSPLVETPPPPAPLADAAVTDASMIAGPTLAGPMNSGPIMDGPMPGGSYAAHPAMDDPQGWMPHGSGPYSSGQPTAGLYDTVPYGDGYGAASPGPAPYDGGYGGGYDTVPYEGGPYDGGPYDGGGYDTVPYGEIISDGYAQPGGELFDEPWAGENLFGFDRAIWPGFVSGNFMPGTDRLLYGGELFAPLYQDGRTLWYFNFRGQGDDNSASEFNTGTGVRVLTDPGWIFGGYAFWDHLRSQHGNTFNQGMIGLEAMSVLWDARFNVYFPESGPEFAGPATASVSGGNLVVSSGIERAYWGMDFELGHLLWAWGPGAQHELRGFAALYHFDHSAAGADSITGPRLRGEYRWHDLPYFGPGSRLTFGLTVQADEERDGQLFAFARLRIPLDAWAHSRKPLSPLHRRMLDNVVRDVDVVTGTSRQSERAVNSITGREIRGYARIDANTSDIKDVLDDLDTDSVIVFDGSQGVIDAETGYMLKSGQTVIGGDTSLQVIGAGTGRRATFNPRGQRPTLDFGIHLTDVTYPDEVGIVQDTAVDPPAIGVRDHTQLIGVDIQNVDVGVGVLGADDVLIQDVGVSDYGTAGILVSGSTNVRLQDVRVKNAAAGPLYKSYAKIYEYPYGRGIFVAGSSDVTIEDSHIEDAKMEGIFVTGSQDIAIRKTTIRDTALEGIRLVNTKNVLIEEVELKNTGAKIPDAVDWAVTSPVWPGSITLRQTENTTIRDSFIHGSEGYGIYGEDAVDTLIEVLQIVNVEHGIGFYGTENMTITDTTIRLSDGPLHAQHSGIALGQSAGEVLVAGNDIQGGDAGWGIFVESGAPSTTLWIEDNVVEKSGEGRGIGIQTVFHQQLDAAVAGNTVTAPGDAFWLFAADASNNIDKSLRVTDNEFDGPIRARILGSAEVELIFEDNHFGGDPMGEILAEDDARLSLEYRDNTSESGAALIRFEREDDAFIFSEVGAISGNDHQPDLSNVSTVIIDPVP